MNVIRYSTADDFLHHTEQFLLAHEAENNLILGVCSGLRENPPEYPPLLASIVESGNVVGAAVMIYRRRMVLTSMPDRALHALADNLIEEQDNIPGVNGPVEQAESFGRYYAARTGCRSEPNRSLRIFSINDVLPPQNVPGTFRKAEEHDHPLLTEWTLRFHEDIQEAVGFSPDKAAKEVAERIRNGGLYIWEDREPVSMAAATGPTPNGIRINYVYTPPTLRGRGYASACTAALSSALLNEGRGFCFLYTDLSNATSNRIYQNIGYRRVCDVLEVIFTDRDSLS